VAVCARGKALKSLDQGCSLSRRQPVDEGCQHGRRIGYMAVPDLPIVYRVFAHHDCMHNQYVSIFNRVCGETPIPDHAMMRKLQSFMRKIGRSMRKVGPWTLDQVVEHYHGSKRVRYAEAADHYRAYGLSRDQSNVKMFIKCEKIKYVPGEEKRNPDPRAIQYRDPVYAVVLATYLKPIEEVVYQLRGNRLNGLPPLRVIGKGLNQEQRATLLVQKWSRFERPTCFGLDASRFDQHVSADHLRGEHALYLQLNNDPEFARLLSWQLRNRVRTSKGIVYTTLGKRMSGDMNTALGNCVLMVCMLALFFEDNDYVWDCLDDGDDILLLCESADADAIAEQLPGHFLALGMKLKVESRAEQIEDVEWCQSHPVNVDGTWKFIRNPAKVLSGALVGHKWLQMHNEASRRALANTIGLCEKILNDGVPVLSHFAEAIIRNAHTSRQVRLDMAEQLVYRVRREVGKSWLGSIPVVPAAPISDVTRLSFQRAFGITVDEQLRWEAQLQAWKFTFEEPIDLPSPITMGDWSWETENLEVF